MYVDNESDTIKTAFEKALRKEKRQKYDHCRLILKALVHSVADEGMTKDEIMKEIQKTVPSYSMRDLNRYLGQLQTEKRGSIVRHNENSDKYTFNNTYYKIYALALFSK